MTTCVRFYMYMAKTKEYLCSGKNYFYTRFRTSDLTS